MKLEKIKHGFKTLAECGGIRGVDDTSSFCIFCKIHCNDDTSIILKDMIFCTLYIVGLQKAFEGIQTTGLLSESVWQECEGQRIHGI
jgi:hypothetical protein